MPSNVRLRKLMRQSGDLPNPWRDARVTVVVPTYNEADSLPHLIKEVMAVPLPNLRLLVVDDSSPDGTAKLAEDFAVEHLNASGQPRIDVLHRSVKEGLGRAYLAGMHKAIADGAEFVVQMDADLSHPPQYLAQMLGVALSTSADLVIGSRYVPGGQLETDWGLHRLLLSHWANFYVNTILNTRLRDATAGYRLWRTDTLRDMDLDSVHSNGYSFQVEMAYRALRRGHKVIEIPIHFKDRQHGNSKMDFETMLESALMVFRLRWYRERDRFLQRKRRRQ